jgi:hypothetical protein
MRKKTENIEAPISGVTSTSYRHMNRGFSGIACKGATSLQVSKMVEGAKQFFKLIFFMGLIREHNMTFFLRQDVDLFGGEWIVGSGAAEEYIIPLNCKTGGI